MRHSVLFRLVAIFTLIVGATAAQAAEWRVAKIFGDAWIEFDAAGVQKVSLTPGFEPGRTATIRTGSNGKVYLVRNRETMIIGSDSVVTLPADSGDGWTTINQRSGIVTYDVEKRNVRHFEVRTPTLVAVVKGTRFKVTQNRYGSKVTVTRGLVEVTQRGNGDTALVPAGQKAVLDRGKRGRLRVVGPGEKPEIIRKAEADLAPPASGRSNDSSGNASSGSSNSASSDAGSSNSGSSNSGSSNSGSSNSGNGNSGSSNSGNGNSGSSNSGNGSSGSSNSGSSNSGNGNSGNGNSGNGNSGSSNSGNGNSGNGNSGRGNGNSDPNA